VSQQTNAISRKNLALTRCMAKQSAPIAANPHLATRKTVHSIVAFVVSLLLHFVDIFSR